MNHIDLSYQGLETGGISTVFGIGTAVTGTDTAATFTWTIYSVQVTVHNFTADADPSTVTDPNNDDTDGDGIHDGVEDCDMPALVQSPNTLKSSDLNGKYDGMTLNETDPLDRDTDDDGLKDGAEDADHDGLWDWNPTQFSGETCSWTFDSDADGLGDGLEAGKILKDVTSDTDPSIFIPDADSATHTNPLKVDSDLDGVPDGWIDGWTCNPTGHPSDPFGKYNVPDHEFQWGEGEDINFNGIQDPTETEPSPNAADCFDADQDGLLDGWDNITTNPNKYSNIVIQDIGGGQYRFWGELSFGQSHYLGQYDLNIGATGQLTGHYQTGPTDPTNKDSDGDGLIDGYDPSSAHELALIINTASTTYTDPSAMDSDGDGLSDGMELAGWEVHILLEKTKVEVRNWTVSSNPIKVDTEHDGVTDYQEFENQSDPNNNDTDSDRILDQYEDQGELTQVDGKDPEILKFEDGKQVKVSVHITYYGIVPTGIKMVISVRLKDNAGLEYVYVKLEGQSPKNHTFKNHQRYVDQIDIEFDMDWLRSLTGGYDINITVADVNGNGNCTKTHIDGLAEGVVKALIKGFWSFVEAVKKLASMVFDWIWNAINNMFNRVFKPILDAIESWKNNLINSIKDGIKLVSTGGNAVKAIVKIWGAVFEGNLINTIVVLFIVLKAVELMTTPFTLGIGTLLSTIITTVIPLIISAIIGSIIESFGSDLYNLFSGNCVSPFIDRITSELSNNNINGRGETDPGWMGLGVSTIIISIISIIFAIKKESAKSNFNSIIKRKSYKDLKPFTGKFNPLGVALSAVAIYFAVIALTASDNETKAISTVAGVLITLIGILLGYIDLSEIVGAHQSGKNIGPRWQQAANKSGLSLCDGVFLGLIIANFVMIICTSAKLISEVW
jgi:hypothetical protein